jgi:integrase
MSAFTSRLGPQIERFLVHKRALGRGYHREEAFLREIDRSASLGQNDFLSEQLVRTYFSGFTPAARPNRLTLIRQLARFLVFEETRTFIPSTRFLGIRRQRPVIRVLSCAEASRFLDACDHLPPTSSFVRRVVHGTALRLLLLTGLRRGEVIGLKNQDVDLDQSTLHVRGNFRPLPVNPVV